MANHKKTAQPVIPVTSRKLDRNFVRNRVGSNRINKSWRDKRIVLIRKFIDRLKTAIKKGDVKRSPLVNKRIKLASNLIYKLASGKRI